ncbi:MAG: hypothetical protein K2Y23_01060 [Cyanobacteria bacterium]|nr:hypothetical protein [Cyanobacteriota bacterium]
MTAIDGKRSFTWMNRAPGVKVIAHHSIDTVGRVSRATLSLRYEGWLGGFIARLTRGITNRYLAMEANGLHRRHGVILFRSEFGTGLCCAARSRHVPAQEAACLAEAA